jgi:hypothetical protein
MKSFFSLRFTYAKSQQISTPTNSFTLDKARDSKLISLSMTGISCKATDSVCTGFSTNFVSQRHPLRL